MNVGAVIYPHIYHFGMKQNYILLKRYQKIKELTWEQLSLLQPVKVHLEVGSSKMKVFDN